MPLLLSCYLSERSMTMFHIVLPELGRMLVPRELSEQGKSQKLRCGNVPKCRFGCLAIELSWTADLVNRAALGDLNVMLLDRWLRGIIMHIFAPLFSHLEWESRLVDEFSKDDFLIPINLRGEHTQGASDPILTLYAPVYLYSRLPARRRCCSRRPCAIRQGGQKYAREVLFQGMPLPLGIVRLCQGHNHCSSCR